MRRFSRYTLSDDHDSLVLISLQDEHAEPSEGFWRELFLLRPDCSALRRILDNLSTNALLHHHEVRTM